MAGLAGRGFFVCLVLGLFGFVVWFYWRGFLFVWVGFFGGGVGVFFYIIYYFWFFKTE